jgi:hypothetical protein
LGNLIKANVSAPIGALATSGSISTLNLGTVTGHVPLSTIDYSISASNAHLTPDSGDVYKLTLDVSVTVTDSDAASNAFFDLGRNVDQLGIKPTLPNLYFPAFDSAIDIKAGLSVNFTAGVDVTITDLGGGTGMGNDPAINDTQIDVANDDSGFFMENANILASADIDTAAQNIFPTASLEQFGFLDVDLTLKSFTLDGNLKIDLQDSLSHSNTVTFANLDNLSHSDAVASGTIASEVDVTVDDIAGTSFATGFDSTAGAYQINFFGTPLGAAVSSIPGSGDHRTAPQVKLNDAAETQLEPYKNVSAGAVAGMLKSYAEKLGTLPASSVLNTNLPLATGTTLGDLIPIGKLINDHLISIPPPPPPPTAPSCSTAMATPPSRRSRLWSARSTTSSGSQSRRSIRHS